VRQSSKAMKRMYHLRKLREFKVDRRLLELFYHSIIESVATYGIAIWGGNVHKKDRKQLDKVRKVASRIVGKSLISWEKVYDQRVRGLAHKILADKSHPLNSRFRLLPSSRRLQQVKARKDRYAKSFVAEAIRKLNK